MAAKTVEEKESGLIAKRQTKSKTKEVLRKLQSEKKELERTGCVKLTLNKGKRRSLFFSKHLIKAGILEKGKWERRKEKYEGRKGE